MTPNQAQGPSNAFIGAAWLALLAGSLTYLIGLWNAGMQLNEKGYYFTILMYGLFAAISLQKSVRDRNEGSLFAAVTVQKNVRDAAALKTPQRADHSN